MNHYITLTILSRIIKAKRDNKIHSKVTYNLYFCKKIEFLFQYSDQFITKTWHTELFTNFEKIDNRWNIMKHDDQTLWKTRVFKQNDKITDQKLKQCSCSSKVETRFSNKIAKTKGKTRHFLNSWFWFILMEDFKQKRGTRTERHKIAKAK